ncbi:hypothetical protein PMAYCL1PPCAC_28305, partial [Pristionchus mayeri]
ASIAASTSKRSRWSIEGKTVVSLPDQRSPYSPVEREYWYWRLAEERCPRGCDFRSKNTEKRKLHYQKFHYHIYFPNLSRERMTPLENWTA